MDKDEVRARLTPQQWRVTQEAATDPPFRGEFDAHFEDGSYHCVVCGATLFSSDDKYQSGCGWPAFHHTSGPVKEHVDKSHGMIRTEVVCGECDAHLGHVFEDGPPEQGGLRYCINSSSLAFSDEEDEGGPGDEDHQEAVP